MSPQNPQIAEELGQTKIKLEQLKAEKLERYPPDPHPFIEPDRYPREYTPQQIEYRNQLIARIEELERRIEDLQDRLYIG